MDSDSDSSSYIEEPIPIVKYKPKSINFEIDNFEETFRVTGATAEQILKRYLKILKDNVMVR